MCKPKYTCVYDCIFCVIYCFLIKGSQTNRPSDQPKKVLDIICSAINYYLAKKNAYISHFKF